MALKEKKGSNGKLFQTHNKRRYAEKRVFLAQRVPGNGWKLSLVTGDTSGEIGDLKNITEVRDFITVYMGFKITGESDYQTFVQE